MAEESIVGARGKSTALGVVSLFAAVAAVGVIQGDLKVGEPWMGWPAFVIFGAIGVPVFASMTFRPHRLILRPEGLTVITTFAQRYEVKWSDIEDFFVWRLRRSAMVAYRLHDPNRASLAHDLGAIRSLGGSWKGGSEQVVERLNRYREACLDNS